MTLGGQSSGGTSIFALLASPASRGLFAGAIALSGSPNITINMADAEVQNAGITAAAGCGSAGNASATVACLRAASTSNLAAAIPASWGTPGLWGLELLKPAGMGYAGLVIVDGVTLTMSFEAAMAAALVDVPFMSGNMGQECVRLILGRCAQGQVAATTHPTPTPTQPNPQP